MKIASWNVNSLNVRLEQLRQWCEAAQPDVLGLQETKTTDDKFPAEALDELGYHVVFSGQKTYNGVALISREPPQDVVTDPPEVPDHPRRIIAATYGDVRVVDLYVVNGKAVGTDKYEYKLDWLSRIGEFIQRELESHPNMVVVGDFNIAPDDRDVYDSQAWHEKILCSTPEREALQVLTAMGFADTYRLHHQEAGQFSWWDYRGGGFPKNQGLRIDLVLASAAMAGKCSEASIDPEPRGWERPSDHTPVMATFDL